MKRKTAIAIVGVLGLAIASLCVAFDVKDMEATNTPDAVIVLPDEALMLVVWQKTENQFMFQLRGPVTVTTVNNKMFADGSEVISQLNKVDYGVYVWQEIIPIEVWDDDCECSVMRMPYMDELNLQPIGADDLPHSQHIAKLIGIDQQAAKPAIVARKFLGEVYTVNCLVSQSVFDMYLAGDLSIGDYVIVSFIDEIPDTTELNIAIVVDKVKKTW